MDIKNEVIGIDLGTTNSCAAIWRNKTSDFGRCIWLLIGSFTFDNK